MTLTEKRRALITGASSGIGKATAIAFARAGIDLVLVSRSQEALAAVASEAESLGVQAAVCPLDLSLVDQVKPSMAAIAVSEGPIDIVVNAAGMAYTGPLSEMSLADWQRVLDLNLTSVFLAIQGLLPTLRQRGQSTIINVASVASYQAFPDWGAYCASKFALLGFSKALAAEERAHGVRVAVIAPGSVNTSLWDTDTVHADFDRSKMLKPEVVAQAILQMVQMPQEAVVEELMLMPSVGTF